MIKKQIIIVLAFAGLLGCVSNKSDTAREPTSFFVHPIDGKDQNPGTITEPFKTIDRVNQIHLVPGDKVLFFSANTYPGTLVLEKEESGEPGKEITISSYDASRAYIDGGDGPGIVCKASNVNINNFRVIGSGSTTNQSSGIIIESGNNIVLEDLEISGFKKAGLLIKGISNSIVRLVYAYENGEAGILLDSLGTTVNHNVDILNCRTYQNGLDHQSQSPHGGIIIRHLILGAIRLCASYLNGSADQSSGGITITNSEQVTISESLIYQNNTYNNQGGHGIALGNDTKACIVERNLTYQNSGYAQYLTSEGTAPWGENILRYNISDNDGLEVAGSLSISGQGKIKVLLHNNIWINDTKPVIDFKSTAVDDTIRFYNNALQVRSTFFNHDIPSSIVFHTEKNNWYSNPTLPNPFKEYSMNPDWELNQKSNPARTEDLDAWIKYQLHLKSPLKGKGLSFADMGYTKNLPVKDFWGNSLSEKQSIDIGAYQLSQ